MNKEKQHYSEYEEDDHQFDYNNIDTGVKDLNLEHALDDNGPIYNTKYNKGQCYFENHYVTYFPKKNESYQMVADKFKTTVAYLFSMNGGMNSNPEIISFGNINEIAKESNSSQGKFDSNISNYIQDGSKRKYFLEQLNIAKKFKIYSDFDPAAPTKIQPYNPEMTVDMFQALFPDEKSNKAVSEASMKIEVEINQRFNIIFTVGVQGGFGLSGNVTDDRRFTTSLNWEVGVKGGLDVGVANANVGLKIGGSIGLFDQLSASFESIEHFLAHFHNSLRILIDDNELDPKRFGLDNNSSYWSSAKKELSKGYTSVDKNHIAGSFDAELGIGDDKLGIGGELKKVNITRTRKKGINKIGQRQSENTDEIDHDYLSKKNNSEDVYEWSGGVNLSIPIFKGFSVNSSLEYLKVVNDANKDNDGEYWNLQIELPIASEKYEKIRRDPKYVGKGKEAIEITNETTTFINSLIKHKDTLGNALRGVKQGASALTNQLSTVLTAAFYHKKETDGYVEQLIKQKTSVTVEINSVVENGDLNLQYIRFWLNNEASASSSKDEKGQNNANKVKAAVTGTSRITFGEIVMEDTLSYISTVYNQMMWEARDPEKQKDLEDLLKASKKERLEDEESYKKYDSLITTKLIALRANTNYYSCGDWEGYKNSHSSAIEGIKNNFLEKFNKHWVKLKMEYDEMPHTIMGFNILRHFGRTKEEITNSLTTARFGDESGKVLLKMNLKEFEELVLFKNYLENRSHASDYWK
ncbi:hypothetical protein [Flammeovirga aprica]|uniref:LysM domain-containing protein n=1 Tax=Flammeovirga aprica JL-4 TaxID=694437 RepID=A0A7X9S0S1_9BACT|nr:hypothetical protein [Flammeovirga aprica]NME72263.1 hypothetical protein [Flammeovirga aprica JL-4]